MVRLINPLFSNTAHGRLGNVIYESGPFGPYAKVHTKQRHKPTQNQIDHNLAFGVASENWKLLTDEQKAVWNTNASGLKMSGFNLFVKETIIIP